MTRLIRRTQPDWRDPAAELRDLWMADHARVELDEIRRALDAAEAQALGDDRVRLGRAALAIREHRLDDAAAPLADCLRRRPDDSAVRLARLRLARESDDPEVVAAELARLPASAMADADLLDVVAWLAARRGDLRTARLALERWVAVGPVEPSALARLATVEVRAGRRDRADAILRRKVRLDATAQRYGLLLEDRPPSQGFEELASLAEELGRPFEALGWWSLARRARPADPAILAAIARLRGVPTPAEPSASGTLTTRAASLIAALPSAN